MFQCYFSNMIACVMTILSSYYITKLSRELLLIIKKFKNRLIIIYFAK